MSTKKKPSPLRTPSMMVDVIEPGKKAKKDHYPCEIGSNLKFNTKALESYFFAEWNPLLYDLMLVAATVEYCDRTLTRSKIAWARNFIVHIPVHDPYQWERPEVTRSLKQALNFLTGDQWEISFKQRRNPEPKPNQGALSLSTNIDSVIPYSDGIDSLCVAGILEKSYGDRLVRVRLGTTKHKHESRPKDAPFASVPYSVKSGYSPFDESSARSRGFKFAIVSAIAAHLSKSKSIYVSESGQGSLGPPLVTSGQAYPDFRTHPAFLKLMENLFEFLLGNRPEFRFPQLWKTKAQTIKEFALACPERHGDWLATKSCWQQARQSSVNGKHRQCGICAACLLRRLSIHGAGFEEPPETYAWENLGAPSLEEGCAKGYDPAKITEAMRQYAIAGVLHLDHLANLRSSEANLSNMNLEISRLARTCGLTKDVVSTKLHTLLQNHETEWSAFRRSLGPDSFLNNWARQP